MRALMVVEGHPLPDGRFRLRTGLPGMQVDALVFESAPQPLDEDIVEETALPIHRYAHAGPAEPIRPGKGRELGSLDALLRVKRRFVSDLFLYAAA